MPSLCDILKNMRIKRAGLFSIQNNKIFEVMFFCLLFSLSFSYFAYGHRYLKLETYHYDEGIATYGTLRILNGDIPYKDFWSLYPPGVFYILAAIFKIFGINLRVAYLFTVTVLSLTACNIYLLVKNLCSRILGILAFLLSLAWLKSYMVFNRPGQLAILFFILCSFSLINFINSERNKWLIITGILAGIVGLFRQDFGLYIFSSIFLIILLWQLNSSKEGGIKVSSILKKELCLFVGSLVTLLPLILYFLANSAFREFVNDIIIFPITVYPEVRRLLYPELKANTLVFYLPLFIFLLTGIRLLFYNWRAKGGDPVRWAALFFLFSGLGLFRYTSVRTDIPHLLPLMIPVMILFILILGDLFKNFINKAAPSSKIFILTSLFLLCFVLLFYSIKPYIVRFNTLSKLPLKEKSLDISRADGFYDDSERTRSLVLAIKYIQNKTERDEEIFIGNSKHDRVVWSDVLFYFLSERHSATKYYELHPGLTTTQEIQKEIINDLNKAGVRYIVLWAGSEDVNEPNQSSKSSGVFLLDNFIQKNYRIEKTFGSYIIMRRI